MKNEILINYLDCLGLGNARVQSKQAFIEQHQQWHKSKGQPFDTPIVLTQEEFDTALKKFNGDVWALWDNIRQQFKEQNPNFQG